MLLPILGLARYSVTRADRLLEHNLRARLQELVQRSPGMTVAEAGRLLGVSRGTLRYHLELMDREGALRTIEYQRRVRLYPPDEPRETHESLAVLQRGRTWEFALAVASDPGRAQKQLTSSLVMSRKLLRKYVDRMSDMGLVHEIRDGGLCKYYPTEEPQRIMDAQGEALPARSSPPSS